MGAVKVAAAAAAFILICIHLAQLVSARTGFVKSAHRAVANPDVVAYWNQKLGNATIPEEVARLVSRLSPNDVTRFQKAIASKSLLDPSQDSLAATFSSAAGLLSYTYVHTSVWEPQGGDEWDANYKKAVTGKEAFPGVFQEDDWDENYKKAVTGKEAFPGVFQEDDWDENYKKAVTGKEPQAFPGVFQEDDWDENYKKAFIGKDSHYPGVFQEDDWDENYKKAFIGKDSHYPGEAFPGVFQEDDWDYKKAVTGKEPQAFPGVFQEDDWDYKKAVTGKEPQAFPGVFQEDDWDYKKAVTGTKPGPKFPVVDKKEAPQQYSEVALDRARHVYFLAKDIPTSGAKIPGKYFTKERSSASGAYLPRPLESALESLKWSEFLRTLRIPAASQAAATFAQTFQRCQGYNGSLQIETRTCARSLEDAADFVAAQLGLPEDSAAKQVQVQVSSHLKLRSPAAAGTLEVVKVEKRSGSDRRQVLCHDLGDFSYKLQACHSVLYTELYYVTLKSTVDPSVVITNVFVCHTQTKTFRADHISFLVLGVKPGDSGICHYTMAGVTGFYQS